MLVSVLQIDAVLKGGGGMFDFEKPKDSFWSIEVHVGVLGNKIMAQKRPFSAIFGNIWP